MERGRSIRGSCQPVVQLSHHVSDYLRGIGRKPWIAPQVDLDHVGGRLGRDAPLLKEIRWGVADPARDATEGLDIWNVAPLDAGERVEGHACFLRRSAETKTLGGSPISQQLR